MRDLVLSPDHAVFVDGVLIPVRYLINSATVIQEQVANITYYHVELPAHKVILAEGLPVESYLDTGNRAAFANGGAFVQLHADFARSVWRESSCAPLVVNGAELVSARSLLLERAEALGDATTNDPASRLLLNGRQLKPSIAGRVHRFRLPATARHVRLSSRPMVPAHVQPDSNDHRRLGVAVSRITLDGEPIMLTDRRVGSGWHSVEPSWRWTDGDAGLEVAGARDLEIEVAITGCYWLLQSRAQQRDAMPPTRR